MTEPIDFEQVQANILLSYAPSQVNCARLMCFRFDAAPLSKSREWMRKLRKRVTFHTDVRKSDGGPTPLSGDVLVNVGLTLSGLEALGYDPFVLANLPEEFRDGMRERAERLGDVLADEDHQKPVHLLVTVYTFDEAVYRQAQELGSDAFAWRPLLPERIASLESTVRRALDAALEGPVAELLESSAVTHVSDLDQDTYRLCADGIDEIEYFGFRDGVSQPRIEGVPERIEGVPETDERRGDLRPGLSCPGTVLLGYPTSRDDEYRPATRPELARKRLEHGSFLVVRRLSQDVEGFHGEVEKLAAKIPNMDGRKLAEMMVGRKQDGAPLVEARSDDFDDFDYSSDPDGQQCPFQSHLRRSHPRDDRSGIRRIMRRGMPYSRPAEKDPEKRETGLMFLAYNADLESQFEFIQRLWLNSGIENHGLSRDRDPIAGEPTAKGDPEENTSSFTFTSPKDQKPYTLTGLQSFVQLRWGEYFLVPSRDTLEELSRRPSSPIREYERVVEDVPTAERARDVLGRWLDDAEMSKRIWEEVRKRGGVARLEKPGVVLVGTAKRAKKVLRDDGSRYSVRLQGERMKQTTGIFYLGMDANTPQYQRESVASADIIPGWKYDGENPVEKQLDWVKMGTLELCLGFLGVSVVAAVADHDPATAAERGKLGLENLTAAELGELDLEDFTAPERGELDLKAFTAFVLSGLTPKFFGVPQPSAGGTFKLNVPASGHVFFPFPPEEFREYADAAAKGVRAYLSQLFEERERAKAKTLFPDGMELVDCKPPRTADGGQRPDEHWTWKLEEVLGKVENACEPWSRDDHVRNMSGIISGMLIASFKLFVDGMSRHAKDTEVGKPIEIPAKAEDRARLPFDTLRKDEASMPNVLYRQSMADQKLGDIQVQEGDFVLVGQGSVMADPSERKKDREWFYGDRTPPYDKQKKTAPHFCPGYRMADAMLETMSSFLLGLKDLRRTDETGEFLDYDWPSEFKKIEGVQKQAAQRAGRKPKV